MIVRLAHINRPARNDRRLSTFMNMIEKKKIVNNPVRLAQVSHLALKLAVIAFSSKASEHV